MRPTRRLWTVAALIATLVALAIVLESPAPMAGAALLGTWLLSVQYRFVAHLRNTLPTLDVDQTLESPRIAAEGTTEVTLSIDRNHTALPLTVHPKRPVGATGDPQPRHLDSGEDQTETTIEYTFPLAGSYTVSQLEFVFEDRFGLFEQTVRSGPEPDLAVEPETVWNVHVGVGGDEIAATYGDHSARHGGTGLDPAELRKYVPGDPSNHIDWKATARLNDTYVREFEARTDREVIVIADLRSTLASNRDEQGKFDYLREVLLSMTALAERQDDPVGLIAVDDDGIRTRVDPDRSASHYRTITRTLSDLDPTPEAADGTDTTRDASSTAHLASRLQGDRTIFSQRLRPYIASRTHVDRIARDPLFRAVDQASDAERTRLLVIATDDKTRVELREAVKLAVGRANQVVTFIAPTALFESYALADLEATYEAYRSFETYRRELDRAPRTQAFEVGPGDRLDAVLAAGRGRRQRGAAND